MNRTKIFCVAIRAALVLLLAVLLLAIPFSAVQAQAGPEEGQGLNKLTADLLVTLTGSALSILAYVIPPFKRIQARMGDWTPAFMAGSLLVVAVVYELIWCGYSLECVLTNWQTVLLIWGTAFATNSGMYSAAIKPAKENARYKLVDPEGRMG